jgi:pilus assembly protein CpaB
MNPFGRKEEFLTCEPKATGLLRRYDTQAGFGTRLSPIRTRLLLPLESIVNRRKLTGVVASIVVAALGTIILLKNVNSSKKVVPAAAAVPTVEVYEVIRAIPAKTPANDLETAGFVKKKSIPADSKYADEVLSLNEITNLVATVDLMERDHLTKSRFQPLEEIKKKDGGDQTGLIKVWIEVDRTAANNGQLEHGDVVAVFANFVGVQPVQPEPEKQTLVNPSSHLIAHKVFVEACDGCFTAPAVVAAPAPGAPATVAPVLGPTVRVQLAVDAPTAERIVYAAKNGTFWLGIESLSTIEANTKIVDRSNVYVDSAPQLPDQPIVEVPTTTVVTKNVKPDPQSGVATPAGAAAPSDTPAAASPAPAVATPAAPAAPAGAAAPAAASPAPAIPGAPAPTVGP